MIEAMGMIRSSEVDMITLGQYLQPGERHLPVDRFPEPSQFADWDKEAREMGFSAVCQWPPSEIQLSRWPSLGRGHGLGASSY